MPRLGLHPGRLVLSGCIFGALMFDRVVCFEVALVWNQTPSFWIIVVIMACGRGGGLFPWERQS